MFPFEINIATWSRLGQLDFTSGAGGAIVTPIDKVGDLSPKAKALADAFISAETINMLESSGIAPARWIINGEVLTSRPGAIALLVTIAHYQTDPGGGRAALCQTIVYQPEPGTPAAWRIANRHAIVGSDGSGEWVTPWMLSRVPETELMRDAMIGCGITEFAIIDTPETEAATKAALTAGSMVAFVEALAPLAAALCCDQRNTEEVA